MLLFYWGCGQLFPIKNLSAVVDNGMSTALHVGGWGVEL